MVSVMQASIINNKKVDQLAQDAWVGIKPKLPGSVATSLIKGELLRCGKIYGIPHPS